jgi:hypothetical protein
MELVESLPEENGKELDRGKLELVLLTSFPNPMQAQMFQGLLESNGVVSMLQSDFNAGAGTYTASPNAILVREVDFPKGRELYGQYLGGDRPEKREPGKDGQDA